MNGKTKGFAMIEKRELIFTLEDLKYVFHHFLASTGKAKDMSLSFLNSDGEAVQVENLQIFYTGELDYAKVMNPVSAQVVEY